MSDLELALAFVVGCLLVIPVGASLGLAARRRWGSPQDLFRPKRSGPKDGDS